MCLGRGCEVVRDADVQLVRTEAEPHATACGEQRRLLELLEPEEVAVEAPGVVLAPGRGRDLDMVETDDVVPSEHREGSTPRVTPGRKANPLLQVGALPDFGNAVVRTRAPFV